MKLNEVIKKLEQIKKKHGGDINVLLAGSISEGGGNYSPGEISNIYCEKEKEWVVVFEEES